MLRCGVERVLERRDERAVELDDVHVRAARGEVLAEDAEAAADLQHDVVGAQRGGALDDAEDVRVHEEVLAQVAPRAHAELAHAAQARLGREVAGHHDSSSAAVRWTAASKLRVVDAAALGDEARGVRDERRLVALLAHDLRREVGRVGLDEQPVLGHALGGRGEVGRLGVGDVAGERDPPALGQALVEAVGHREAVHDHAHPVGARPQRGDRVLLRRARVDDQRLAGGAGEVDLGVEGALLIGARRVVAEVVQAGLADRAAARMLRELLEVGERRGVEALGVVGMAPDGREHLVERVGRGERLAVALLVHADREHARDAGVARGRDQLGVGRRARAEVGVAVDHATGSCLGKSGAIFSTRATAPAP